HITRRESASSSGLIALSRARTWVAASRASNPSVQHKPPVSRLSTRRLDRRLAHRRRGRTARKTYPDQSPLRGRIHPCAEYRHGVVVAGIGRRGWGRLEMVAMPRLGRLPMKEPAVDGWRFL